jgi:hypothetical protein
MTSDTPQPPMPADNGAQAAYQRFDNLADYQLAVDRLLACPGRELRLFDPDLASLQPNSPGRVAQFEAFLAAGRMHRLFIALHDTEHLTRYCPRMMNLIQRYAHAIEVRRTHEEIRHAQDAFMVLDRSHYVRRPVAKYFRGAIGIQDDTEALAMHSRFMEIWSASYQAVSGSTSGLA